MAEEVASEKEKCASASVAPMKSQGQFAEATRLANGLNGDKGPILPELRAARSRSGMLVVRVGGGNEKQASVSDAPMGGRGLFIDGR